MPKPEDMLPRFAIRNGATLKMTLDCYYLDPKETHDPHYHDHINWPSEDYHPGPICQMVPPRDPRPWFPFPIMRTRDDVSPIDLRGAGYIDLDISFDESDVLDHVETRLSFDTEAGENVIRVYISTNFDTFSDKPVETRFTVFAIRQDGTYEIKDELVRGILVVLPGNPSGYNA